VRVQSISHAQLLPVITAAATASSVFELVVYAVTCQYSLICRHYVLYNPNLTLCVFAAINCQLLTNAILATTCYYTKVQLYEDAP
jgi:hypothetical protein